jgi:large subunit ribosomal protein L31
MRADIHPQYVPCRVVCNCGNDFVTRSTRSTIRVEICAACHPFYTGTMKLVDTEGRVDKFKKKYAATASMLKKK